MFNKIFVVLTICLVSFISSASNVYVVKNVKISATDKTASVARNIAIEKGQIRAFQELAKQHYHAAVNKTASLGNQAILNVVEGFELSEERRSATNYFAKLNVRFNREQVDELMKKLGASYTEAAIKEKVAKEESLQAEEIHSHLPVSTGGATLVSLVVPVFEQNGKHYWFEEDNIWLNFWHKKLLGKTNEKFILPVGDLEDLALLNKNILTKNLIDLSDIFEKYSVNNIILLRLNADHESEQMHHVTLQINYLNKFHHSWQQHNFTELEGSDLTPLLAQYHEELQQFQFNSNQDHLVKITDDLAMIPAQTIIVEFLIEKLSDWVQLEQVLAKIKYITKVDLQEINSRNYHFALTHNIELSDLKTLLAKYKFILQEKNEKLFTITKDTSYAQY